MANPLITAIKQAREQRVELDGKVFIISRPTDYQMALDQRNGMNAMDMLRKYVVGWDFFTTLDFYSGGDNSPAEFDVDLFLLWVEDQPHLWKELIEKIRESYSAYVERKGTAVKG